MSIESDARAEADRAITLDAVFNPLNEAFVAGAVWAASRPVEVTDEMADRALRAVMLDPNIPTGDRLHHRAGHVLVIRERTDVEPIVRAALRGALSEGGDE